MEAYMSRLLMTYKMFPCSIAKYFRRAAESLGHEIWTAGTFDATLPWGLDRDYSAHIDTPDYEIPQGFTFFPIEPLLADCPFTPDAIISIDAGLSILSVKETNIPNTIVLTDPHALPQHYIDNIPNYDLVVCMQQFYADKFEFDREGYKHPMLWIPYAADNWYHTWGGTNFDNREFDACIVSGLLYENRRKGIEMMRAAGLNVFQTHGLLGYEMAVPYNNSVIAYNWSSEKDLPARFFEGLAMRNLVLTNRVPDLAAFDGLVEGQHYVAFDTHDEMLEKAKYYAAHRDEAWIIASRGYGAYWAQEHTYINRMTRILDCLGVK